MLEASVEVASRVRQGERGGRLEFRRISRGYLCEPKDALDLKAKMEQMLLLPTAQRLQMGMNSREKMVREFNEQIVLDRYADAVSHCR